MFLKNHILFPARTQRHTYTAEQLISIHRND
jgi:hypothetical protein